MTESPELADADVVRRILAGDADLFGVLVDRYRVRLFRFIQRFTNDAEDARDVTQDVFLKVYGALDSYDSKYKFSTWLFRIAGNAAIDHLRRRRIRALPLDLPPDEEGSERRVDPKELRPDPYEDLARRRLRTALDAAIERLPDDYRELISLRHYGELPYEEIAELKGMPLGTVKNKLFRARQALRDLLPRNVV
ncbi:MAG TPA: sigma-70 family RNA polymerase sigma factor [Thermoanaerobaculia bacterium]|nr:sigma-70 family RNA polymerase sigma factor [Thermoanaerobaculia bacterium]